MVALIKENWSRMIMLLLGVALVFQLFTLICSKLAPLRQRILGVQARPMLERSAVLAFGDQFNEYLQFLLNEIPEDALVVIPPRSVDYRWGDVYLMQFYMVPRAISNCPSEQEVADCIRAHDGERTYFIEIDNYLKESMLLHSKNYKPFDETRGIYVPR